MLKIMISYALLVTERLRLHVILFLRWNSFLFTCFQLNLFPFHQATAPEFVDFNSSSSSWLVWVWPPQKSAAQPYLVEDFPIKTIPIVKVKDTSSSAIGSSMSASRWLTVSFVRDNLVDRAEELLLCFNSCTETAHRLRLLWNATIFVVLKELD